VYLYTSKHGNTQGGKLENIMTIGIPRERRPFEFRVGLSPAGVEILAQNGHQVYVEHEAGVGAGFSDREYEKAGARIAYSADEVFGRADLLLKVARPTKEEIQWLRPGTTIAGFLHLASTQRDKVDLLLEKNITSVAYEQIQLADNSHPVLRPSSEIGGSMTPTIAARFLQCNRGGKGILLGGIPGVAPAEVAILGSGVVATFAARSFLGLGAHVTVLGNDLAGLQRLNELFPGSDTMM
jgi:alanine dehydrogenase